ncbi:hypothetical protein [Sphingomonas soli]|uniref:hypothetical protein n=1 Tax=Sphingomonas soli TaxID=266127 RepID=UPI0008363DFE|nr:hypothetical protein [Sphingomonas soli]
MSTRIYKSVFAAFLLTACEVEIPNKVAEAQKEAHKEAVKNAAGRIECAPPGADTFAYSCAIDMVQSQDGLFLTLRHPDGGFRRLLVTRDGRGVIAADGAEQTVVTTLAPDLIEVAIGGARYRLPATVRQSTKPK